MLLAKRTQASWYELGRQVYAYMTDTVEEGEIKTIEISMAAPGILDDRDAAKPLIDRHQNLLG